MPYLIVMLLCVPPALSLAAGLKKDFAETVPLVMLGITAVGYLFALFGGLWLVPWLLYAAVLAAVVHLVWAVLVRRTAKITALLTPGLAAFLVLALVLWWLCRGRMLTFWDDFSHWGLAVKNTYYLDQLHAVAESTATYKDYPPAGPVLQYIFLKAGQLGYREDVALFTHALLALSLMVYPLHRFGWKRGSALACILIVFLVVPGINSGAYTRLLVDGTMGVLLAYIFAARWFGGSAATPHTMLGCFVLAITKQAGVGLAAMAGIALLALWLAENHRGLAQTWKTAGGRARAGKLLAALGPLLATVAGWQSWGIFKAVHQVGQQWATSRITPAAIGEIIAGGAPEYRYEILNNFAGAVFTQPANGWLVRFPSACWLLVYAALAAGIMLLVEKARRKKALFFAISLAVIHLIFMAGLLLSYLFTFTAGEGMMLASFYRYEATVVTAALLLLIPALIDAAGRLARWWQRAAVGLGAALTLALCSGVPGFIGNLRSAPVESAQTQQERILSQQCAQRVRALGQDPARVYLISQIDDRWALMRLIYELVPAKLSNPDQQTSIATDHYYERDNAVILSPEEWAGQLHNDYDFVYLYNIDAYFVTYYRSLFENVDDIDNDSILRVIRHPDGTVTLRRINRPGEDPVP